MNVKKKLKNVNIIQHNSQHSTAAKFQYGEPQGMKVSNFLQTIKKSGIM